MSTCLLNDKSLLTLACMYHESPCKFNKIDATFLPYIQSTFSTLYLANIAAFVQDYPEHAIDIETHATVLLDTRQTIEGLRELLNLPIVDRLKLIQCYKYQLCGWKDYKSSAAREKIEYLFDITVSKLDGYDEAGWGLW